MAIIDELTRMLWILLIIIVILGAIFFGVLIYYRKKRQGKGLGEEEHDYSTFERRDSEEYITFDDVKDGMLICDNGYRFVAGIRVFGFDFEHAPAEVQSMVQQNFLGFIRTITTPTMYRQHSEPIDMEHTLELYREAYQKVELKLFDVAEEMRNIENELRNIQDSITEEQRQKYDSQQKLLKKKKSSLEWRRSHLKSQMASAGQFTGGKVLPEPVQCYFFDWSYDSLDFTLELSKEQIYEKARNQLDSMARAKIHALQNCHLRAYRCTTVDLIEMSRRYSSPITSNRIKLKDILYNSSYFEDFNYQTNHEELYTEGLRSIERQRKEDNLQLFSNAVQNVSKVENSQKKKPPMPKNIGKIGIDTKPAEKKISASKVMPEQNMADINIIKKSESFIQDKKEQKVTESKSDKSNTSDEAILESVESKESSLHMEQWLKMVEEHENGNNTEE